MSKEGRPQPNAEEPGTVSGRIVFPAALAEILQRVAAGEDVPLLEVKKEPGVGAGSTFGSDATPASFWATAQGEPRRPLTTGLRDLHLTGVVAEPPATQAAKLPQGRIRSLKPGSGTSGSPQAGQ